MKQSEKEALQEKIDELQARLDEQWDEQWEEPRRGEFRVYEVDGALLMSVNEEDWKDEMVKNVTLEAVGGLTNGEVGPRDLSSDPEVNDLGTFDEVFVRRDKIREELKGKFMKMRFDGGDRPIQDRQSVLVYSEEINSFIDNLFDGKNCDGSDVG